jgi:cell division septation protein DedD
LAQDDYYYEIQLTNKQLVFYFLAGATFLISSFLLGVMVGRGVDAAGGEVLANKAVREDRLQPEGEPKPAASAQNFDYSNRLEGDKPPQDLESPTPKPTKSPKPSPTPKAAPSPESTPKAASPKPSPSPKASDAPAASGGTFAIQVGAYKDKASAESVVNRLKEKGFAAFVVSPEGTDGGLFDVRVGSYASRVDAEKAEKRLKDEEKFKPFIVHQ